jgi:SAM-dependent methyltransferase
MSNKATFVYGIDIDDTTVQEAKLKYKNENLEFLTGSTSHIPIDDNTIDVAVSFETIEHHDEHDEMMNEIKRVLKPDGLLIISTPDKLYYSDQRNFNNQFHIKELYKQEFIDLLSKSFNKIQLLTQKYCNGNSIIQDEKFHNELQIFSGNYSDVSDLLVDPLYLIAIVSDNNFEEQIQSIFEGSQIIDAQFNITISNTVNNTVNTIYSSTTYKLGHLILFPFKILKRIFK